MLIFFAFFSGFRKDLFKKQKQKNKQTKKKTNGRLFFDLPRSLRSKNFCWLAISFIILLYDFCIWKKNKQLSWIIIKTALSKNFSKFQIYLSWWKKSKKILLVTSSRLLMLQVTFIDAASLIFFKFVVIK